MITYDQVHELMAQANLAILLGALVLIGLSVFLVRKRKIVWHGNIMLVVMIITGLLVIAHMGPSLFSVMDEILGGFDMVAVAGLIHSFIGTITLFFGIWLVGVWAYTQSGENRFCILRKKRMWRI